MPVARSMTEREMLYLVYGAVKALETEASLDQVVKLLEEFLFPDPPPATDKRPDAMGAVREMVKR